MTKRVGKFNHYFGTGVREQNGKNEASTILQMAWEAAKLACEDKSIVHAYISCKGGKRKHKINADKILFSYLRGRNSARVKGYLLPIFRVVIGF